MQTIQRHIHKGLGVGLLLVVLLAFGAGAVYLFISTVLIDHVEQPQVAVRAELKPMALSSNVLVLGNTFWGRYINDWSMASPLKQAYPFSRLSEFHRDQYDAWLSGLECPTVPDVNMTSAEMEATLTFNCDPSYLPEAAKWFTAFSLANNHTDNQGVEGFTATKQELEGQGIQYFGHYDPRALDDLCDVISLPVTVTLDNQTSVKGDLPVAMCGYHGVFRVPSEEAVSKMTEYAQYMPVLAFAHMGVEYKPEPDTLKIETYRSMVDAGADVVLGDHPHWVQTTESYKGRLIVYSMGNFMFDQQDTQEVVRSAGIRMVMNVSGVDTEQLAAWLELGATCKAYQDDCLGQAMAKHLAKLPVTYQFGVVGTNGGGKIVKPVTDAQQTSILERLRWKQTMSQLRPPYSSL